MADNEPDEPPTEREFEPRAEDAFGLLGNERRLEIIWTLGDAYVQGEPERVSFSELRSQTQTDDPGQLHYHLKQLEGYLINDTDSGYGLRPVGIKLYETLRAGLFSATRDAGKTSIPAGFDCHYCGTGVEAKIGTLRVNIECHDCGYIYVQGFSELPLDQFENELALLAHFRKYHPYNHFWFARGICTTCGTPVGSEFLDPDEVGISMAQRRDVVLVDRSCSYCGTQFYLTVGTAVLAETGVVAFCHEHGIDVLSTPYWELPFVWTEDYMQVLSTDPWRVAVRITLDDETLEVVVDGDLTVVARNRLAESEQDGSSVLSEHDNAWPTASGSPRADADSEESGGSPAGTEATRSDPSKDLPATEECLVALRRDRWPEGVECPHCESGQTVKVGTTSKDAQRYRCKSCETIFNDLTGTVFAERRLTLPEMCYIVREMETTTVADIARSLDRHYTSVLDFVHEVQDAEETIGGRDFLSGLELDAR